MSNFQKPTLSLFCEKPKSTVCSVIIHNVIHYKDFQIPFISFRENPKLTIFLQVSLVSHFTFTSFFIPNGPHWQVITLIPEESASHFIFPPKKSPSCIHNVSISFSFYFIKEQNLGLLVFNYLSLRSYEE